MAIDKKIIDELLKDYETPEDLIGKKGILKQLTKSLLERALEAEMTDHLGYEKHSPDGHHSGNSRNGHSKKKLITDSGKLPLNVPRDRKAKFEPQIIAKRQSRLDGFDDKIISLYARGMTTREIQGHLEEIYGIDVSPTLISNITDAVIDEVKAWQSRPLESVYPIVYLDAIVVKSRQDGRIRNKSVCLALGVNLDGHKELLGLWIANSEGAKFWLNIITELKNRGVNDIIIACVDGLKGFPEAIQTVFPDAKVQLCIVHMVRNSLKYVSWKDRKKVAADLKKIYASATVGEAEIKLEAFCKIWDEKYPTISQSWRRHWENVIPFFDYPEDIRKVIYTTNAIESLNRTLRKIIKNRGSFPTDESIYKLLYLALMKASKKWTMPIRNWNAAITRNHFPEFEELKINRISTAKIEKWITDRQKQNMPIETIRKILVTMGQIFKYAARHKYISYNRFLDAERPRNQGKITKKKIRVLTPSEIKSFLGEVENQMHQTLFRLAIMSGARQGELLGLKWSDVDWENNQIHIQRTFNNQEWYDVKTETSNRKIDLGPSMMAELKKWKIACPPSELNLIFPNKAGQPLNHNNMVSRYFNPALKKAGIERIRFHDLRHTYASLLIEQGENIKYIQNQLGHSSPTVTLNVYAHLMKPANQEAACRLEDSIFKTGHNLVTTNKKEATENSVTP